MSHNLCITVGAKMRVTISTQYSYHNILIIENRSMGVTFISPLFHPLFFWAAISPKRPNISYHRLIANHFKVNMNSTQRYFILFYQQCNYGLDRQDSIFTDSMLLRAFIRVIIDLKYVYILPALIHLLFSKVSQHNVLRLKCVALHFL